jgi:hypothetical protein
MNRPKFSKPPIMNEIEKEKMRSDFINGAVNIPQPAKASRQETKRFTLRMPANLYDTVEEISNITGQSMNSICLEFIWESVKQKIKYLKE